MTHSGQTDGRRAAALALSALLLGGALLTAPASAQMSSTAVSPEMAAQKARMLEAFFSSKRLRDAVERNPEGTGPLKSKAQANLNAGRTALEAGQFAEAITLFDEGMRAVSQAVALGTSGTDWDESAAATAFVSRRRHAEAYLVVLERADDVTGDQRQRIADLRARLDEADRLFTGNAVGDANEILGLVYRDVVGLVSDVRRGHTVVVSRVFETPEEEYQYERERHESYGLLVRIALAERAEDQPGLAALAARLGPESQKLREQAEAEFGAGDAVTAIATMERATERLLVILRTSGLIMME